MTNLTNQLESLLLVTAKPISQKKLAEILNVKPAEVAEALIEVEKKFNQPESGIRLLVNNQSVQLVSSPDNAEIIKNYLQDDISGELTDPSIETLTIVAYRQPVTKAELEQIRGVNCSLILRNLLIRGLIEAEYSQEKKTTVYNVTLDFLKFLGLNNVKELPEFEKLNSDENLMKLLENQAGQQEGSDDKVIKVEVKKIK